MLVRVGGGAQAAAGGRVMRAIWHGMHWGFGFAWGLIAAAGVFLGLARLLDLAGLL